MQNIHKLPWEDHKVRVAVIGDLIIDEYLDGTVNRISPEAPVPIHQVKGSRLTAGGAANVARNVQLAGGTAIIMGVWGNDQGAHQLNEILTQDGIDTSRVIVDHRRPTTRKTRITAGNHQIARIDWETTAPISAELQAQLISNLRTIDVDAMVVSDYGKGVLPPEFLTQIFTIARAKNIPTVVDPKGKDFAKYQGAYLITPNRKEAMEALGLDQPDNINKESLAEELKHRYHLQHVMITLGAEGMYCLFESNSESSTSYYLPAQAREVYDVSGAGDTVAAIMALGIGAKADIQTAMRAANTAAGKVVEKWGTQPILWEELKELWEQEASHHTNFQGTAGKIVTRETIRRILGQRGKRAHRVVFTNGCFDILHAGHISYLEAARAKGDLLMIGLNSDDSVRRLKGLQRPIIPCDERARLLAALACVDYVVQFDEDTPLELIEFVEPDVLVKGADWKVSEIVGADSVLSGGGRVEAITFVEGLSTSNIIKHIQSLT